MNNNIDSLNKYKYVAGHITWINKTQLVIILTQRHTTAIKYNAAKRRIHHELALIKMDGTLQTDKEGSTY